MLILFCPLFFIVSFHPPFIFCLFISICLSVFLSVYLTVPCISIQAFGIFTKLIPRSPGLWLGHKALGLIPKPFTHHHQAITVTKPFTHHHQAIDIQRAFLFFPPHHAPLPPSRFQIVFIIRLVGGLGNETKRDKTKQKQSRNVV